MTADPVSAALAPEVIADRWARALRVVLGLADDWEVEAAQSDRLAEKRDHEGDSNAACLLNGRAQAYRDLAGELRSAVCRELLGGDAANG